MPEEPQLFHAHSLFSFQVESPSPYTSCGKYDSIHVQNFSLAACAFYSAHWKLQSGFTVDFTRDWWIHSPPFTFIKDWQKAHLFPNRHVRFEGVYGKRNRLQRILAVFRRHSNDHAGLTDRNEPVETKEAGNNTPTFVVISQTHRLVRGSIKDFWDSTWLILDRAQAFRSRQ